LRQFVENDVEITVGRSGQARYRRAATNSLRIGNGDLIDDGILVELKIRPGA